MTRPIAVFTALLLASIPSLVAVADEGQTAEKAKPSARHEGEKPEAKSDKSDETKWHTVEPGPLKVDAKLTGIVEAERMWPVKAEMNQWSSLKLAQPVRAGQHVKKGQVLFTFEVDDIDRAIAAADKAAEPARLALEQARHELAQLEINTPREIAEAERKYKHAIEDIDRYEKVDRDLNRRTAQKQYEAAQFSLDYNNEELQQLLKMYKEDELTEETEEIILRRQKRAVENAKFNLEKARAARDKAMKMTLPRQEAEAKRNRRKWETFIADQRVKLPLALNLKRASVAKMEHDRAEADAKLARLKEDRKNMVVKAPADGIVYFGKCVDGNWSFGGNVAASMQPGESFKPNTTIVTIVQPRPVFLRASVKESDLYVVRQGVEGVARSSALPGLAGAARVRSVAAVPIDGKFDVTVDVTDELPDRIVPGMTFDVRLTAFESDDALTVPLSAVNEDTPGESFVKVRGKNGKTVKRRVSLGWRTGDKAQVVKGLKAGDKVKLK